MVDLEPTERITVASRLLQVLTRELDKQENKQRLRKGIVQPLLEQVESCLKPYIVTVAVLILALIALNVYLTYKYWSLVTPPTC